MTTTIESDPGISAESGRARRRLGLLAAFAAAYTYLLVVFGGVVRITGSGMGCGEDWPKCNGQWIPPFTFETVIEYTHRLLAAGIGLVVLVVVGYAFVHRNARGIRGRDGLLGPGVVALVLVLVQAMLGAITVWLELPTAVTVAHFLTAMLFLAALLTTAVRAGIFGAPAGAVSITATGRVARIALLTAVAGLIVAGLGAVTANTPGAPAACMGFPLCNGQWLPRPLASSAAVHWLHRFAAFAYLLLVFFAWRATRSKEAGAGAPVRRAACLATFLVAAQIAVAAGLVLQRLPQWLQAAHLAVGAGIWVTLAVWVALARREERATLPT